MRLSPEQKEVLLKIVREHLGQNSDVYLFGSRLDDAATGGDVDILVEVERPVSKIAHVRLVLDLEEALGLPVDAAFRVKGEDLSAFQKMIVSNAKLLEVA
jgi:predicted nucleotidyltransferase